MNLEQLVVLTVGVAAGFYVARHFARTGKPV